MNSLWPLCICQDVSTHLSTRRERVWHVWKLPILILYTKHHKSAGQFPRIHLEIWTKTGPEIRNKLVSSFHNRKKKTVSSICTFQHSSVPDSTYLQAQWPSQWYSCEPKQNQIPVSDAVTCESSPGNMQPNESLWMKHSGKLSATLRQSVQMQ